MIDLYLTPKSENDLKKIFEHTYRKWGLTQADQYQDELYEGILVICSQPKIGKPYPFFKKDYQKFHVNKHLIFYRLIDQKCVVVRILHQSMDLSRHL